MRMRIEKDRLGTKEVPEEAYYGVQTLRALENFPINLIKSIPICYFKECDHNILGNQIRAM